MNLPFLDLQLPWLADTSLRLTLVLAAFLLVRPLLRRFVGSAWLSALWLVLLARLLAPWPLATPFGLANRAAATAPIAREHPAGYEVRARVIESSGDTLPAVQAPAPVAWRPGWREAWLAGVAIGLAALGVRAVRTARLARKTEPAQDSRLLEIFAELPEEWRRGVSLRETDALSVPTLAGLMRPTIWMPRAWLTQLSEAELRHVLLHELGHARRHDLLVQWLFSLAVCVHWFNPLAWLAARCARADREMACDAWVLARSQNVAPDEYGATLLKTLALLREPLRLAPSAIAMAASKRGLFTRIATLGGFRVHPTWRGVAGLLALGGALTFLTTTRLAAQQPAPTGGGNSADAGPASGTKKVPILGDIPVLGDLFQTAAPDTAPAGGAPAALPPVPAQPKPGGPLEGVGAVVNDTAIPLNALTPAPAGVPAASGQPQIEIAARFVEVTDSASKQLDFGEFSTSIFSAKTPSTGGMLGMLAREQNDLVMKALNGQKGVDLLSAPRVTTRSGQRAVIEIIREFRYPTEFDRDDKTPPNITPTAFETRNLGVTLEVEPTIGPDGRTIDLNLVPQVVELTGYNRLGAGGASTVIKVPAESYTGGTPTSVTAGPGEIIQPIFSTRKITTNVTIFDGQTVVLGGLRREGDIDASGKPLEPRQLIVFISAQLVNAIGAPRAPGAPPPAPAIPGAGGSGLSPLPPTPGGLGAGLPVMPGAGTGLAGVAPLSANEIDSKLFGTPGAAPATATPPGAAPSAGTAPPTTPSLPGRSAPGAVPPPGALPSIPAQPGAAPAKAPSSPAPLVKSIEVQQTGPGSIAEPKILGAMRTRTGQPYDSKVVEDDVRSLSAMSDIANVRVFGEPVGGGVKIIVVVTTKPPAGTPAAGVGGTGAPLPGGTPAGTGSAPVGAMAYATAVQGKPGYVTSPHAPQAGYIDVRGFPPGTQVKCPYSGKMFLVP